MSVLKTNIKDHLSKYERVVKAEHIDGCDFVFTDRDHWYAKKVGLDKYTSYTLPTLEKERLAVFGEVDIDSHIKRLLRESLDHYEENWGAQ